MQEANILALQLARHTLYLQFYFPNDFNIIVAIPIFTITPSRPHCRSPCRCRYPHFPRLKHNQTVISSSATKTFS
jgi:hypothetical protein